MPDPTTRLNAALEGRYRIERELGEGGMATVYLADDLKHERRVALKVLKPELAAVVGAERFLAEIKTTASLQHPNILPLHDSGEADSLVYYVMPYVEGESLRDRLDRERQLPVDDAVKIAVDVAEALQAAHEQGVVHRDIKPGNILISRGKPLIADFGIALAVSAAGGGARLTETGLSLGTPYYMSPEQATGDQAVGASTDTYALGSVLYEMLVGDPPYAGSTAQAVLGKIIAGEPVSATKHRPSVPTNVDAAIRKSLEKLPADRFTSAGKFAKALADSGFRHGRLDPATTSADEVRASRSIVPWILLAASVVIGGWGWLRGGSSTEGLLPLTLTLDLGELDTPRLGQLAISPDGSRFAVPTLNGNVHVRSAGQSTFTELPGTEGATQITFSPDGEWLAYQLGGSLRRIAVSGGSSLTLVSDGRGTSQPHWGESGSIVFSNGGGQLKMVAADGSGEVVNFDVVGTRPHLLPDGSAIVYEDFSTIKLLDLETRSITELLPEGTDPSYIPTGHLVYAHPSGGLFAARFDLAIHEMGPSTPVFSEVAVRGTNALYSISKTGTLVYGEGDIRQVDQRLVLLDPDGSKEPVRLSPRVFALVRFSPDGRRIAFNEGINRTALRTLFTFDLVLGELTQVAFDGGEHRPIWSPDGTHLVYSVQVQDSQAEDLFVVPIDGSSPSRRLVSVPGDQHAEAWTEGGLIVYSYGGDLFTVDADGTDGTPTPYLRGEYSEADMAVSPDERFAAYVSDEDGTPNVYVRRFPEPETQRRVTTSGGREPRWSDDGTVLYYRSLAGDTVYAAETRTDPSFSVAGVSVAWLTPGAVGPWDLDRSSGRGIVAEAINPLDDLVDTRVTVIVNWFEELERLVAN